jgi:hypothetical protein
MNAEVMDREFQNYSEYKHLESFGLDVTPSLEALSDFLPIGCTWFDREFMGYCSGGQISAGNQGCASAKHVISLNIRYQFCTFAGSCKCHASRANRNLGSSLHAMKSCKCMQVQK